MSTKLEVCIDHTGKMEGINSLSTSTILNKNCRANAEIKGSICSKCYAENMCCMYHGLAERLARNTATLTERILEDDELIDTTGQEIFRFESFGDLNNEIQLTNYLNIARKNPNTRFTLWTKMYKLVYDYFKRCPDVPENFTLILSSLMINEQYPEDNALSKLGIFEPGQLKIFTVYDKKYIEAHPELVINCGSRECNKCRCCYNKNRIVLVNEILKSDRDAAEKIFTWRDPNARAALGASVGDILEKFKGGIL